MVNIPLSIGFPPSKVVGFLPSTVIFPLPFFSGNPRRIVTSASASVPSAPASLVRIPSQHPCYDEFRIITNTCQEQFYPWFYEFHPWFLPINFHDFYEFYPWKMLVFTGQHSFHRLLRRLLRGVFAWRRDRPWCRGSFRMRNPWSDGGFNSVWSNKNRDGTMKSIAGFEW